MDAEKNRYLLLKINIMAMLSVPVKMMLVHQCALDAGRAQLFRRMHRTDY